MPNANNSFAISVVENTRSHRDRLVCSKRRTRLTLFDPNNPFASAGEVRFNALRKEDGLACNAQR
jgi:hypothetical protein